MANPCKIRLNLWPGGRVKALTMSYDDGSIFDRRLVEVFNVHAVRGTFHLNSSRLGKENCLAAGEVKGLFAGHEVSAHAVSHPYLPDLPPTLLAREILEDRKALEALVGYPVRGLSYPYGFYDEAVVAALPGLGVEYARATVSHYEFAPPLNPLVWQPTCHHKDKRLMELTQTFLSTETPRRLTLLYVWGHSYEFDRDKNWDSIEQFCLAAGNRPDVWYATNIEIVDYIRALHSLRFTVAADAVFNPSAQIVWIEVNDRPREIAPGATTAF